MNNLEQYYRNKVCCQAYDLFAVFSRFEYAMKKGGFRQNNSAEASWQKFAGALPECFFSAMQNASQARVYFDAPPKHLICNDDTVSWSGNPVVPENTCQLFTRA